MEIIQERLEREYDLDLITTAPSVVYQVHKTDGDDGPHREPGQAAPSRSTSTTSRSPSSSMTIHVPAEYVGAVLALCQDRRGMQKGMQYLEQGPRHHHRTSCRSPRCSSTSTTS